MEYEIRKDSPFEELVEKAPLFANVLGQVNSEFLRVDMSKPRAKEKWRQVRKVASEYLGNLYDKDKKTKAQRVWFELNWKSGTILEFVMCHDGVPYNQAANVATIKDGLGVLKATAATFFGTGQQDGIKFEIEFENSEVLP